MTAVISLDCRDGFGSKSLAKVYPLMQRSSHAIESTDATKSEKRNKQQSSRTQEPDEQSGPTTKSMPSGLARPDSPPPSDRNTRAPTSMMRDRYRYDDDDTAVTAESSSRLRGEGSAAGDEWRHSAGMHKRRHSQRSPSRPRSQQGSQAAQIANVKEAERKNEQSGRFPRLTATLDDSSVDRAYQHSAGLASGSQESPRKVARLDSSPSASRTADPYPDWQASRAAQISESEPTSASSSRILVTRSLQSSTDEGVLGDQDEVESNYTWRQRSSKDAVVVTGNPASPTQHTSSRLPPLMSGYRGGNPVSASGMAAAESRSDRSSSPPPRLPGFAVVSPYHAQGSTAGQTAARYSPTLPSQQRQYGGRQRGESFGMPSYVTSPRVPGRSSVSGNSPSLSHSSHATPGQAFIHPSLAGLPGAGGGAGSKQQPSFVSKLYSMLEDDTIEDMIAWGASGTTFSVANPAEFAKVVLPNWFKHSNWQSFVRQLNMYGFHKVNHTYQGTPEEEIQVWEFKHPSFRRGEVHLLGEIKRKSSRHKRQDSLSRSMNPGGYDDMGGGGGGTPSPEMGMTRMHAVGHHMGGGPPPPPSGFGAAAHAQVHPGQQQPGSHQPYARPRDTSYRGEYGEAAPPPPPPPPQAMLPQRASGPPPQSGAGMVAHPLVERVGVVAGEGMMLRMDDLSDRIDAIIRHATYLEGQLRTVSDQLFHAQQNEASLRTHVHHLESQMRSLSDQLFQQQRHMLGGGGQRPPSPPTHQQQPSHSGLPPPPPSPSASSTRDAPRFQAPGPPHSQSYPERSPVMGNPSYPRGAAPPGGSGRSTPASSADAYTKLGPPPPPPPSGSGGRMKDEMSPR